MAVRQTPLPKHFNTGWAIQKLADYLRQPVNNLDFMSVNGPYYHWELGWYIHLVLDNADFDEYVISPDGRVFPGTPPD